jgi:HD-like signal output (HDOD) protein
VLEDCRDDDSGARRVADTVSRDPALAAHVLRVANSAAYAPPEPIVSLPHAVGRMGLTSVAQIVVAVCVKGRVFRADRYTHLLEAVWPQSAVAAGWAREVARLRGRDPEGAFLVGLLHDVGRPVVLQALIDIEKQTRRAFGDQQAGLAMDYLHPRVGAQLMRLWNMPESMASAIAWHHDPGSAPEHADEAWSTAFAECLALWTLEGDTEDPKVVLEHGARAALELDDSALECVFSRREHVQTGADALV